MKTITFKGFVHCQPASAYTDPTAENIVNGFALSNFSCDDMKSVGYTLVGPSTVTVEVPDNWNPSLQVVETLNEKKRQVQAEFAKRITEIEREINRLTAITCEVSE